MIDQLLAAETIDIDQLDKNVKFEILNIDNDYEGFEHVELNLLSAIGRLDFLRWLDAKTQGKRVVLRHVVKDASHMDAVACLRMITMLQKGTDIGFAVDFAAMNGHYDIVKYLIENGHTGKTSWVVTLAAMTGHLDVLVWLLEHRGKQE